MSAVISERIQNYFNIPAAINETSVAKGTETAVRLFVALRLTVGLKQTTFQQTLGHRLKQVVRPISNTQFVAEALKYRDNMPALDPTAIVISSIFCLVIIGLTDLIINNLAL